MQIVSSVVNSIRQLCLPLEWVQTCIAVLPVELLDMLDAPLPFIVGVLHPHFAYYLNG